MTFEELQNRWMATWGSLPQEEVTAIELLLASDDEEQVKSTFDLLLSLGGSALCAVLHKVGDQCRVREDTVRHRLLWEKCILQEVTRAGSDWHELYLKEHFLSLSLRFISKDFLSSLSADFRKLIFSFCS